MHAASQGYIKLPDREPSRLAAVGNGLARWTCWRLPTLVSAASRDGSRSYPELMQSCRLATSQTGLDLSFDCVIFHVCQRWALGTNQ